MTGGLLDEVEQHPPQADVAAVAEGTLRRRVQVVLGHQPAVAVALLLVLRQEPGQRDVEGRSHLRVGIVAGRLGERSLGVLAQEHHPEPVVLDPAQVTDQLAQGHQR